MFRQILLAGLLVALSSFGRSQPSAPNGCGSGWNAALVPDYIPLLGCEMKPSCDRHDLCYAACEGANPQLGSELCAYRQCESGGALQGQPDCSTLRMKRLKLLAQERRDTCDQTFYNNLAEDNAPRPACLVFAHVYKIAVAAWGESSFIGLTGEKLAWTSEERQQSKAAFKTFLLNASTDELRAFNAAWISGTSAVDVARPIRYDNATRRLVNAR